MANRHWFTRAWVDNDHRYSPGRLVTQIRRTRDIIRRTAQSLKDDPKPDTFLGRKTQEPFPKQKEKE